MQAEPFRNRYFAAARLPRFSGPRPSWADRSSRRVSRAVAGPPTDRGSEAVIQGAATYRRIRCRDHGHAVGDESASRDRKILWGGRRRDGNFVAAFNRWSAAMPQPNDLSRSLVALDQNSTIIAVVELSQSSWLVGGVG